MLISCPMFVDAFSIGRGHDDGRQPTARLGRSRRRDIRSRDGCSRTMGGREPIGAQI